ncbi:PIN domain-containing protein [Acidianus sp. HS-5]|uniref:type II toxin-antitoxin system VapC family toxin n=1 Tax=Acidianus sp. HS-5 TaxID=2886040 RepID=UPI001F48C37F|nr:PIN domain-containing protein [Acidianus sp. HS-5]BDC18027.1 hypothetical protein HS5_09170 [Acidianus sp. HS-5]
MSSEKEEEKNEEIYLIDTDILFSKKYLNFREKKYRITSITLYEFIVIIRNKYIEMMKKGYKHRAEGYLNFLKLIKNEIKNSVVDVNKDDILKSINLIFEREINVGDAINVEIARKINALIVSNDKDYSRVKDLVKVITP